MRDLDESIRRQHRKQTWRIDNSLSDSMRTMTSFKDFKTAKKKKKMNFQ